MHECSTPEVLRTSDQREWTPRGGHGKRGRIPGRGGGIKRRSAAIRHMGLGFRLFGLPIQVSIFFLVMSFLLRPDSAHDQLFLTVAWMAIVFVGVLTHELGHALTAR